MTAHRSNLILAVLALAGTTFALLQAIVVPALPQIGHALGAGAAGGAWILTVNLLATAVLTPILGRLGDMHGKDRMLRGTLAALGTGTLICALAPSLPVMLAGRALQGAGGAIFPLAFGIIRDELPRERVAGAIGLVSSLLGIGAGLGLVVPGPIVAELGWHWLFWLPLGVLAMTGPLVVRCVPASRVRTPAPVNLGSSLLMVAGLSALLIAVSQGGVWGWASARTLGVAAGGALVVAGWVRSELASVTPLVDMRLMAVRGVWTTNLAAFLLGIGMYASIALIPALVELPKSTRVGFGGSVTAAGLFMLPTATVQLVVGPLTGRIERRIGSRAQLIAGMVCVFGAYAALTVGHRLAWEVIAATVVLGLGLGLGLGALGNLIVVAVPQAQTGVATAMNTVMRTLGGAFGAQVTVSCLTAGGTPGGLPGARGFILAFGVCAAALALGAVCALAIPGRRRARPAVRLRPAEAR
jgi:MFS family permease